MLRHFERAILALAETVVAERQPGGDISGVLGKSVAQFLMSVHARMPDYLSPLFYVLVLIFNASPLLRKGKFFHQLSLGDRLSELDTWRRSRIEVRRRFVEFYGSLGVFGLYSDLYGTDYKHDQLPTGKRAQSR
ncbi:hypothetical protein ASC96_25385 [Rhizobium sp. Root1204]|nr:hypothetical protein ASC96_25385 [Rhizobium sp. Root1204]